MALAELLKKSPFQWQTIIALLSLIAIIIHFGLLTFQSPKAQYPLLAILLFGGMPLLFQIAFKLLKGNLGADSLAALALVTGILLEQYLAATFIILMLASGQSLEYYAMRKASSVLLALVGRMPSLVHRRKNNQIEDINLEMIQVKDEIIIYPHETCPVDGVVIEGEGSMDESYLTGEPYQIAKTKGTYVLSGAINGEYLLVVKTSKMPKDSRYAAIVEVLKEAEQKRPSIRRLGDHIGAIFTPLALIIALWAWAYSGESLRFLSVLVIATPCPLLIAIPIIIISAISRAAKLAIIIKDPTVLERLPTCKTAIFDKTGTLTYGKPKLTAIFAVKPFKKNQMLQYIASLERYSKHPLAGAALKAAEERKLKLIPSMQVSEKPGQGLQGIINQQTIKITGRSKLIKEFPQYEALLPPAVPGLECIILVDNHYAATFHFQDAPRVESKSFIKHLAPSHQFKKVMLVSGDREAEVRYLADLLDVAEIHASQSPEQKLAIVREERQKAPTVFMGDGINDAPALTAATVGIAFGQYSNVTAEAAGAVIMENHLSKVDELIHLSLLTRRITLQSAIGGMILSVIGMGFAFVGFLDPVTGAILQEVIDVLAILNALRLTWGNKIKIDLPGFSN